SGEGPSDERDEPTEGLHPDPEVVAELLPDVGATLRRVRLSVAEARLTVEPVRQRQVEAGAELVAEVFVGKIVPSARLRVREIGDRPVAANEQRARTGEPRRGLEAAVA